jgi:tetratricopeptide (TPR) repeat protein
MAQQRQVEVEHVAEKARLIQKFLHAMTQSVDWPSTKGRDVLVLQELLDDAARKVESELSHQPRVAGAVHEAIGVLYRSLGQDQTAETHLRAGLEAYRQTHGEEHPDTLASMYNLAALLRDSDQLQEAESLYRRTLDLRSTVFGEEHPDTLQAMTDLADIFQRKGDLPQAERLFRQTVELRRRVLGERHLQSVIAMHNLGRVLRAQRRLAEAETCLGQTVELARRVLPPDHLITLTAVREYGQCLTDLGRFQEAEPFVLEAYQGIKAALGEHSSRTIHALGAVVSLYEAWGRPEKVAEFRRALAPA